jgi:hypothetical protein
MIAVDLPSSGCVPKKLALGTHSVPDFVIPSLQQIEVVDRESGKQIISTTSNLGDYGCHVRTDTPFHPGTKVKMTMLHQGITFRSEGRVDHRTDCFPAGERRSRLSRVAEGAIPTVLLVRSFGYVAPEQGYEQNLRCFEAGRIGPR